jgi:hypothetical protein
MTKDEAIAQLKIEQSSDDTEGAHVNADNILCRFLTELGFPDVVAAYEAVGKWYA